MEIEHFCHRHPLTLCDKEVPFAYCFGCNRCISGLAYFCSENCGFQIDQSCAELPLEIKHPFHPQHSLTLLFEGSDHVNTCHACGYGSNGLFFGCSECRFQLDVSCISLMPTKSDGGFDYRIQCLGDTHPLIRCDMSKHFNRSCSACILPFEDWIYVCLECRVLLHRSCAELPEEMKHPFHPQHSLTLLSKSHSFRMCHACGDDSWKRFVFCCSECLFELDISCALLMPTKNHEGQEHQIQHLGQKHPLIFCAISTNFNRSCSICMLPFEDSIYICLECKILLHRSCAELPLEIRHPFHPHPLTFLLDLPYSCLLVQFYCAACGESIRRCTYECFFDPKKGVGCHFYIHAKCASLIPNIKCELHEHPLVFFHESRCDYFSCNACSNMIFTPFFRCVVCYFNLHVHCNPSLPHTIKHGCHLHPLTLTNSPIKDYPDEDDDTEFYCDACEKRRNLVERTYFCAECLYVAHVSCVISEVLHFTKDEYSLACKLESAKLDTSPDLLKKNTDEVVGNFLIAEIEGAKLENDAGASEQVGVADTVNCVLVELDDETIVLHAEVEARKAELEKLVTKLEDLKKKRAQHYALGMSDLGND